jgi:hypothetical protein
MSRSMGNQLIKIVSQTSRGVSSAAATTRGIIKERHVTSDNILDRHVLSISPVLSVGHLSHRPPPVRVLYPAEHGFSRIIQVPTYHVDSLILRLRKPVELKV